MAETTLVGTIQSNFIGVLDRIEAACGRAQRTTNSITLVAVSKLQPIERVQTYLNLMSARGQTATLGENYAQEYEHKRTALGAHVAHLIGPLQSNKVRKAVQLFDVIQSVQSLRILTLVATEAARVNKTVKVFLQVNISDDPAKSGFGAEELLAESGQILALGSVELRGLMTITEICDSPDEARPHYARMRALRAELAARIGRSPETLELSMGMSDDFEVAIEEGADLIRVGTALFGPRPPKELQ